MSLPDSKVLKKIDQIEVRINAEKDLVLRSLDELSGVTGNDHLFTAVGIKTGGIISLSGSNVKTRILPIGYPESTANPL